MSEPSEAKGGKSSKMPTLITPALVTSSKASAEARLEPATRKPSRAVARISTERLDGYFMTLPLVDTVLVDKISVEIPGCSESDTPPATVQALARILDNLRAMESASKVVDGTWIEQVTLRCQHCQLQQHPLISRLVDNERVSLRPFMNAHSWAYLEPLSPHAFVHPPAKASACCRAAGSMCPMTVCSP